MAYNRKNLLTRIIEIQNITLEQKKKGVTQIWVYNNLIKDRFNISIKTFNNYLGVNAKKELKELEKGKE
ncbi:MAG TPA: hypothetical protein DIW31_12515 [Bacteroidales bacterium]|nr:hypothetical protein [Bacteroidales bacterium]